MRNRSNRDKRGRWQKGFCPNPNGRPPKKERLSDADVLNFKNSQITMKLDGVDRQMSRHEWLMHRAYEIAMKNGSILAIRKLLDLFNEADMSLANALRALDSMRRAYAAQSNKGLPEVRKLADDIAEVERLLAPPETENPVRKRRSRKRVSPQSGANWRAEAEARMRARQAAAADIQPGTKSDEPATPPVKRVNDKE